MSAASASAVAAAYFSISQHSLKSPSTPSSLPLLPSTNQKSAFHGLQLEGRRISSIAERKRSWGRKDLEISARTAGASKSIEVEVDKPLGLTLGQKPSGGVVITAASVPASNTTVDFELSIVSYLFPAFGNKKLVLLAGISPI